MERRSIVSMGARLRGHDGYRYVCAGTTAIRLRRHDGCLDSVRRSRTAA